MASCFALLIALVLSPFLQVPLAWYLPLALMDAVVCLLFYVFIGFKANLLDAVPSTAFKARQPHSAAGSGAGLLR